MTFDLLVQISKLRSCLIKDISMCYETALKDKYHEELIQKFEKSVKS